MMLRARVTAVTAFLLCGPFAARAQEPMTRAELLDREREEKAAELTPSEPGRLERVLLALENRRFFERVLNPAEGIFPKLGNVTAGSGFSFGPGYRHIGLFGEQADFTTFAMASLQRYWVIDVSLQLPRLADEKLFAEVHGRRFDYPDEDFFGLGPDSNRDNAANYGYKNTVVGGSAGVKPLKWLSIGGGVDHLSPRIRGTDDDRSLHRIFDARNIPGFDLQPDFLQTKVFVDANFRHPRGNPRRGGQYKVSAERFHDRDRGIYSFNRVEADLQQYIPFLRDRRVIALQGLVSMSDKAEGTIPFYMLRTLGGPDDLRGFRRYRFRDQNLMLMQAEYRWEIFTAMDAAIFYDTGKVASTRGDLGFDDLESDYGVGFRFGTINGVFLRIEAAFGSDDGKHFILRYGHVF
jgi:outer membrane protein assembly factor BamA